MQIAINSGSLSKATPEAIERASRLGFQTIEINLQNDELGYGYRRKTNGRFYRTLKKQLDNLGMNVWSTTTFPLTQRQMFFERARKDILMSSAIAAGVMGSKVFVVEPADIFTSEFAFNAYATEGKAPPMIEGYDEAWVQAANRQVSTAMVNADYWLGIPLTNQAERVKKITFDLGIGWAMDVRSALRKGTMDIWLDAVGDRLAVAHVYDVDAEGNRMLPTKSDWADTLPRLAKTTLKTIVIDGGKGGSDAEIQESYQYIQGILNAEG